MAGIGERSRRTALAAAASLVALGIGELALRADGFSFDVAPASVEFGWPNPEQLRSRYVRDPDLFWVPRDYRERLRRLADRRPDLVLLGDSCTEFGAYPKLLAEQLGGSDASSVTALGVGGWTSYQGLQQLVRDVLPLRPRVVTFYFGWNDHWLGFGVEDKEIHALMRSLGRLGELRLAQLVFKAELTRRLRSREAWPRRVSVQDFSRNLEEMTRRTTSAGAVPVLLTAPSSHEQGSEPEYLAERWLRDKHELVPLHREYTAIVREVASREGATLCDLAARFDALPREDVRARYFMADGIHLTADGNQRIAEFLLECFAHDPRVADALSPLGRALTALARGSVAAPP